MDEAKKTEILNQLNKASKNTLGETLDIVYTDVSDDHLTATMPVTPKVHQPYGIMHGGASCVWQKLWDLVFHLLTLIFPNPSRLVRTSTAIICVQYGKEL